MPTPTEIYDAVEALAARPPAGGAFGLALMAAAGAPAATITRTREAAADGAFTWTRMLRFEAVEAGGTGEALARMRVQAEAQTRAKRPRLLIAYDGEAVAVHDTKLGDTLQGGLDALALEPEFLYPLGGLERYAPAPERLADVRATKYLSRLFDAVRDANPTGGTDALRHALNVFMARVLFCLFSDDVGIFEKNAFESAVTQSTRPDGSDLAAFLSGAFAHMNVAPDKRVGPARGWSKLEYVNGGLFNEAAAMPALDGRCRKHLLDCAQLDWREINPDIFGSMLQAVVDPAKRAELGMHYTSPANILKVLGPILLDDLRAALAAAGNAKPRLRAFLAQLKRVRVFDPACGSGNFLIIAYKELRALEMEAFARLGELPHDVVTLDAFFGIEIDDFACQTARLGLWIAQYQMDELCRAQLGRNRPFLPLGEAGRITRGNAAEVDWLAACPPEADTETVLVGNPQFKGSSYWTDGQRADMARLFDKRFKEWGNLDYVALWFLKGAEYAEATGAPFAFVATNSIVQGVQVAALWPRLLQRLEIRFAHRSFKWSNLARDNAGVICVIVGLGPPSAALKKLFDGDAVRDVGVIGPYLAPGTTAIVAKTSQPIAADLRDMTRGNQPTDGGHLILDRAERDDLIARHPQAIRFVRRLYGSQELMKGIERWCLWIGDEDYAFACTIAPLAERFRGVAAMRAKGSDIAKSFVDRPHRFLQRPGVATSHTIMVPAITSENRIWLPVDVKDDQQVPNNKIYALYDGAVWQAGVLSSRLHRLWLETVGGRLKEDPSYSNQLVWNTFPLPALSEHRKAELEEHWWEIDLARKEAGFGRSLGELYAPKNMPPALRAAHEALDATMERIFGERRYRSDADCIEHLLQLYESMLAAPHNMRNIA